MSESNVHRRRFHKLTVAAVGGLVAGAGSAFAQDKKKGKKADKPKLSVDPALLLQEPHTCRGLNSCKGQGQGEKNACGGQGECATVAAHECKGENACEGQGGCGGYPGQNTCKGKGHCAVPLSEETWGIARKQYEHLMADAGKKFGDAPQG